MIIAVSFAIKSHQRELLQRMLSNVLEVESVITDLQTHSLSCSPTDILLVFGMRARKLLKENIGRIISFPELIKLEPDASNENTRYEVYQELLKLKEELNGQLVLTAESLPDLSTNAIVALEILLRAKGETLWHGVTKDNRSICLSLLPCPDSIADIALTFAELFALRAAMETLQIRELSIGRTNKGNINSPVK